MPTPRPQPFRRMVNATRYSLQGLGYMLRHEAAARYEIGLFVFSILVYALLGAPFPAYIAATALFLLLLAMEAINTAIEVIINRISPEISETGKHAKDLGSLAVFCVMIINILFFAGITFHGLARSGLLFG